MIRCDDSVLTMCRAPGGGAWGCQEALLPSALGKVADAALK